MAENLLKFVLCLFVVFSLVFFIPFVNNIMTAVSLTIIGIKLAEWLMEITRKFYMYERVSPKGKAILITGCDTGFGNALARRMDSLGYTVFATCLFPDGEGARKLIQDCSSKLTVLPMDVTDEQSIKDVKVLVEKNLERNVLWAIVNNAGIAQCGQVDWTSMEEIERVCNVNTYGALRVVKAFLPLIKKSKGRIVNVNSSAGRYILPGCIPYCMSKSAGITLTTGLKMELHKWGIKCISIEPFLYTTPFVGSLYGITEKAWNIAPAHVKEEYGEEYFKGFKRAVDRFLFLFGNSNVSQVIGCMEDAITTEDPLSVYTPGNFLHKMLAIFYPLSCLDVADYVFSWFIEFGNKPLALLKKKKYM